MAAGPRRRWPGEGCLGADVELVRRIVKDDPKALDMLYRELQHPAHVHPERRNPHPPESTDNPGIPSAGADNAVRPQAAEPYRARLPGPADPVERSGGTLNASRNRRTTYAESISEPPGPSAKP